MEVTIKYPKGHSYKFQYKRWDTMYCPVCGNKGIWYETGAGDYYVGPSHYCEVCASQFTIQEGGTMREGNPYYAVIKAIREREDGRRTQ